MSSNLAHMRFFEGFILYLIIDFEEDIKNFYLNLSHVTPVHTLCFTLVVSGGGV